MIPNEAKNWRSIYNNKNYLTESEKPILKKDEHRAEIIDISDGLVIETVVYDFSNNENEIIDRSNIQDAFSLVDWSRTY